MTWLVAIDDTDDPSGGCTTDLARAVIDALGSAGPPRLVRLNPATPHKTRGNAAVVLPVEADGHDPEDVCDVVAGVVESSSPAGRDASPGVAVFTRPPDDAWYERGVRTILDVDEARAACRSLAAATWERAGGRGLVGALCAAAWRPSAVSTWESIAYRRVRAIGTERRVDHDHLARLDRLDGVFDCFDEGSGRPCMVPSTPCPVLYGLRGTDRRVVEREVALIPSEPVEARTLFVSNQASDDHLSVPGQLEARTAGVFEVRVEARPRTLAGGHVTVRGRAGDDDVELVAFEPTGGFRRHVRDLSVGDRVVACGGVAQRDGVHQVHLEKFQLVARTERPDRPACPSCGRSLKSAGADAGLRCRHCGLRRGRPPPRLVEDGAWFEVPPRARRHIARPLSLGLAPRLYSVPMSVRT